MRLHRNYVKTTFGNGEVREFNPLIVWHWDDAIHEIGFRGNYAIGYLWKFRIGSWSRIKTRFLELGPLTIYVHYGECEPYTPREKRAIQPTN